MAARAADFVAPVQPPGATPDRRKVRLVSISTIPRVEAQLDSGELSRRCGRGPGRGTPSGRAVPAAQAGHSGSGDRRCAARQGLERRADIERALYVACNRVRDRLLVTGAAPTSDFLDDLQTGG